VTLHQGAIEDIFLDAMREKGLEVGRPVVPTKIRMSQDVGQLRDPNAYAITASP
jgi:phenol 2-monooxygenase